MGSVSVDDAHQQVGHHGAFEAEWQVTGVAEDGHFKDLIAVNQRDAVFSFGQAVIIPHFPLEAANKRRDGSGYGPTPVPGPYFRKQAALAGPYLHRSENKKRADPQQREQDIRIYADKCQPRRGHPCRGGRPGPGFQRCYGTKRPESVLDPGAPFDPPGGAENGGQDG